MERLLGSVVDSRSPEFKISTAADFNPRGDFKKQLQEMSHEERLKLFRHHLGVKDGRSKYGTSITRKTSIVELVQLAKQHAGNFKHDGHKVSVSAVEEVDSEIEEEDQDFEDAQQQIQLGESTLAMNRMSLKEHQNALCHL